MRTRRTRNSSRACAAPARFRRAMNTSSSSDNRTVVNTTTVSTGIIAMQACKGLSVATATANRVLYLGIVSRAKWIRRPAQRSRGRFCWDCSRFVFEFENNSYLKIKRKRFSWILIYVITSPSSPNFDETVTGAPTQRENYFVICLSLVYLSSSLLPPAKVNYLVADYKPVVS